MDDEVSSLPYPSQDIYDRDLPIITLDSHSLRLYRSHGFSSRYTPVQYNFSPDADTRFNAPNGEYGILYLGCDPFCAFVESFGHDFVLAEHRVLSLSYIRSRCLCTIEIHEDAKGFRLVNLTDGSKDGFGALNLDNRIATDKDREITRKWALAFWNHHDEPDGILYRSCNDPERFSIAMFDRAGNVFRPQCDTYNYLTDDNELAGFLDYYEVGLADEDEPEDDFDRD